MKKPFYTLSCLLAVTCGLLVLADDANSEKSSSPSALAKQALSSLEAVQKASCSFSFDDEERFNWDFVPREQNMISERKGVALKELSSDQRKLFHALLKSALSDTGYRRAENVRLLEGILLKKEGAGRRFTRDPDFYFFSFFGSPGARSWGWRLEGHHLCLNFTYNKDRLISATPFCMGANPARVQDGKLEGLRVLGALEDSARELIRSLSPEHRDVALGKGKTLEIQARQKRKYDVPLPPGLSAAKLTDEQKTTLKRVIGHFTENFTTGFVNHVNGRIEKGGLDNIQVTWRGSVKPQEPHSYIIHGPSFVISYVNDQNAALHVHAAFRQLGGDFGL